MGIRAVDHPLVRHKLGLLRRDDLATATFRDLTREITYLRMLCLVAAPEGIAHMNEFHPDVEIYAAGIDARLNDKGHILPGLGDAGDRLFGTR